MAEWWLYQLSITDRTNIVCFTIVIFISIICILVLKRMKSPYLRFRILWIVLMDIIGVVLLVTRLSNG